MNVFEVKTPKSLWLRYHFSAALFIYLLTVTSGEQVETNFKNNFCAIQKWMWNFGKGTSQFLLNHYHFPSSLTSKPFFISSQPFRRLLSRRQHKEAPTCPRPRTGWQCTLGRSHSPTYGEDHCGNSIQQVCKYLSSRALLPIVFFIRVCLSERSFSDVKIQTQTLLNNVVQNWILKPN